MTIVIKLTFWQRLKLRRAIRRGHWEPAAGIFRTPEML